MPAAIRRLLRYYGVEFYRLWIPQPEDLEGIDLKAIIRKSSRVETQTWFDRDYLLAHFTAFDQKYAGFFRKGRAYLLCNMEHNWGEEEIYTGFLYHVADGDYCNTAMMVIDYAEKVAVRVDCKGMR